MEAWIYDAAGRCSELPVLLGWEMSYGFCSPCDCFEVRFVYVPEMQPALRAACRFRAAWEGKTVFFGVVDELELSAGPGGCIGVLRGRGMQALLLDSEAESAEYTGADLRFLLERHVLPFGVTLGDAPAAGCTPVSLSVRSGESHWSVISRYAEFCLGLRPRFDTEGRLLFDGADSGRRLRCGWDTAVTEQKLVQDRYGVISDVIVKHSTGGGSVTVENPAFKALGGKCVRVLNVPRRTGFDAMRHTGQYQIERSGREFLSLRITVPECFAALPGDRITLENSPLGADGAYAAESVRSFADGTNAGTVLVLRPA